MRPNVYAPVALPQRVPGWRYDPENARWVHPPTDTQVSALVLAEDGQRFNIERWVAERGCPPLPERAWPVKVVDPVVQVRMVLAIAETRRILASVGDVRELYAPEVDQEQRAEGCS
jgi:hypothetical protein